SALDGSTHYLSSQGLRVGALLWAVLTPIRRGTPTLPAAGSLLLLATLGLGLLASERLAVGLDLWASAAVAAAVFVQAGRAEPRWLECSAKGIVIAGCAQALWAAAQWLFASGRPSGGFFNPNYLAAWLAICSMWTLSQGGRWRLWATPVLIAGVLATGSRSATLGLVLGIAVHGVFRLGVRAGLALTVAGIGAALAFVLRGRWVSDLDSYGFDRVQIWPTALKAGWLESWGWGLGDASHAFRMVGVELDHGAVRFPKVAYHAHNELLQLWVELGWLSLMVVAALLLALSPLKRTPKTFSVVAAAAVPALLGGPLRVPVILCTIALFLGSELNDTTQEREGPALGPLVLALAAIGLAVAFPGNVARLLRDQAARLQVTGTIDEARRRAEWAEALTPGDASIPLQAAALRYQQDQNAQTALETLYDLVERYPGDPRPPERAERVLGSLSASVERDRALLDVLNIRAAREPNSALVQVKRARALLRLNRADAARKALQHALVIEPNCANALALLATQSSDPAQAKRLAAHALKAHRASKFHWKYPKAVLALSPGLEKIAKGFDPRS
ncbi:MAG: O-antigen ligase family protein, partial [Myxococcota bacterium]